jgi:hypothetical protein
MAFPYTFPFTLPDDGSGGAVLSVTAGISHVANHTDLALARLAEQYRDRPNLAATLSAVTDQNQALEDALYDSHISTTLEGASAAQLDVLGRVVDQARQGLDDESFRHYLRSKIRLNRSNGTADDVYAVFALVLPLGATMRLVEMPPAGFELQVFGAALDGATAAIFVGLLGKARAAGVGARLHWSVSAPASTFTLDAGPGLDVGHLADAG